MTAGWLPNGYPKISKVAYVDTQESLSAPIHASLALTNPGSGCCDLSMYTHKAYTWYGIYD